MAVIKCKMCGGDLVLTEGSTVAQCEYCGTMQTVPSADSEKKLTLFARANRLRAACEFDKAAGIYETIVADFPEEAEAYWGLVLCKYGIEYVDDPATGKKVPTCHRSSFESIFDDSNYEQSLENTDVIARKIYREEAKQIEEIRKGIIEVSSKEDPYDIFICYKETDEKGNCTLDSVLAQDIYDILTDKGYRTFFARITLEDKLGQEYEPYIFAALNSAKIMLVVGTDYEYFNAVWVKNEWSRFLHLISMGQNKTLIPCYKNIDVYDMPKEFTKLQAQDLGKIGAVQDLIRGVDKLFDKNSGAKKTLQGVDYTTQQADATVSLGIIALNVGDVKKAVGLFEEALRTLPDHIGAYLGLIRAISNEEKVAPYVSKIVSTPVDRVIAYVKEHSDILGDLHKFDTLLERSIRIIRSPELAIRLLEIGADARSQNALLFAISELGNVEVVQKLLDNGADATENCFWSNENSKPSYAEYEDESYSLLAMAVNRGVNIKIVKALVEAGADPNSVVKKRWGYKKEPDGSYSVLNAAVRSGNRDLVEYLLQHGADPSKGRDTCIHYTDRSDIERRLWVEYSNLSETVWNTKDKEMLELLLKHGADVKQVCRCHIYSADTKYSKKHEGTAYCTALSDAILYSTDTEIVKMLLEAGADPHTVYRYETPQWPGDYGKVSSIGCGDQYETRIPVLGLAVQKGRKDVIELLVKAGATFDDMVSFKYYYRYDHKRSNDEFPLKVLAFDEKVVAQVGGTLQTYGWKGSKSFLLKSAHTCSYSW